MIPKKRLPLAIAIAIICFALAVLGIFEWRTRSANTSTGAPSALSFRQLFWDADAVVLGFIAESDAQVGEDGRKTAFSRVLVQRHYKGSPKEGERVLLLQRDVWKDPVPAAGDTVLLFLKEQSGGELTTYTTLGMYDGLYPVLGDLVRPSLALNPAVQTDLARYHYKLTEIEQAFLDALREGPPPTPIPSVPAATTSKR